MTGRCGNCMINRINWGIITISVTNSFKRGHLTPDCSVDLFAEMNDMKCSNPRITSMCCCSVLQFASRAFMPTSSLFSTYWCKLSATLPQSIKGTRAHHHYPCASCCMEKAATVSFPLVFNFPHCSNIFLPAFFPVKLLLSQQVSATFPQSIKGTIACRHHPHWWVVWRRQWWWFFLLFVFSPLFKFMSLNSVPASLAMITLTIPWKRFQHRILE